MSAEVAFGLGLVCGSFLLAFVLLGVLELGKRRKPRKIV